MGGGYFRAERIFFVNTSLAGIFFPYAKSFFLGYSLCMKFFHSIFPFMNFFWSSPAPITFLMVIPYSVCNGGTVVGVQQKLVERRWEASDSASCMRCFTALIHIGPSDYEPFVKPNELLRLTIRWTSISSKTSWSNNAQRLKLTPTYDWTLTSPITRMLTV